MKAKPLSSSFLFVAVSLQPIFSFAHITAKCVPTQANGQIEITQVTPSSLSICPKNNVSVSYTATGVFVTGNIFTVQLSDASGSFASPINIGSLSTISSGTIDCIMPANTPAGTNYKIRVTSSNPVIISNDSGADIKIYSLPVVTASSTAATVLWGTLITLTGGGASSYVWAGENDVTDGVGFYPSTTTYTVIGTDENGCENTATIAITVNPLLASVSPHAISGSYISSFSICRDSTVRAWGGNNYGQLGDGSNRDRRVPVEAIGLTGIISLSQSKAVKNDGSVWAWGLNKYGQLGDGTTTDRNTPVQVHGPGNIGFLIDILTIASCDDILSGGGHTLALKNDGTVWTWGANYYGQLGIGDTINRYTPVQVSSLTGIIAIEVAYSHSLALKKDGSVWAWGYNNNGQLGDGTNINRHTPVQVHGTGNVGFLSDISALAAGLKHSLALKNDSTVWAWGYGEALGNGQSSVGAATPVQVHGPKNIGFLTGITAIASGFAHSLALKKDSTVWTWGSNNYGELGDGTTTEKHTPVQVSGLTDIISIASGAAHSLTLKNDGTVWTFGNSWYGQLGNGISANKHIPVHVVGPCIIPATLTTNMTVVNASSCSINDGSVTAVISGNTDPYTYSWSNGQTTATITGLAQGTYTLTITDTNHSVFISITTVNCVTAVEQSDQQNYFIIYPNPNSGIFTIESSGSKQELIISNILGEKVFSQKIQNEKSIPIAIGIDLSEKPDGIYFLQLKSERRVVTQKLIISR